jgi:hypothetical protein
MMRIIKSRRSKLDGQGMWLVRGTREVLVGKIPLGRPRHRWKDNIRMDI